MLASDFNSNRTNLSDAQRPDAAFVRRVGRVIIALVPGFGRGRARLAHRAVGRGLSRRMRVLAGERARAWPGHGAGTAGLLGLQNFLMQRIDRMDHELKYALAELGAAMQDGYGDASVHLEFGIDGRRAAAAGSISREEKGLD